jgi:hypothetical protein
MPNPYRAARWMSVVKINGNNVTLSSTGALPVRIVK